MDRIRLVLTVVVASFLGIVTTAWGADAQRAVVSLEGTWRTAIALDPADTPPAGGWGNVQLPATTWIMPVDGSRFVWYQREAEIPASAAGGHVFVDLRGALYMPRVYVDGKFIGAGSDGWSPTVVEITKAVTPGKRHQIAIRCQDRGAFFPEGFVLRNGMSEQQQRGNTLGPVGGYKNMVGLWDRVLLRVTPGEYIDSDELVIVPSTRKSNLTISGKAAAAGAVVAGEVLDGEKVVLSLPGAMVADDGAWSVSSAFADARYWSPEDPHLYTLRLTLRKGDGGPVLDQVTQRFGFKEIRTDGPDFYLNGVKRHLLGTSTWPNQGFEDPAEIRKRAQNIKASNAVVFRPHTCPWQEAWLDAADELGLLIIDEAAVYTDGSGMYGYTDPRFWDNYRKHVAGMIRRDRNRASLAMWSLGNEILFMNAQRFDKDLPKKLGDLARYAKTIDATHPYTFEADRDPDGAYDVIGLHYPHEMPWNRDYPNTTDWLGRRIEAEAGGGMLGQASGDFFWERKKPLYIGEYLWVPQGDYSCATIWSGDLAMTNRQKYHGIAQRRAWYDQTIAYRREGVSGMCPWTALGFGGIQDPNSDAYRMQKEFYQPLAAYWRLRGMRFFAGDTAKVELDVFNDTARPAELELQLRDMQGGWPAMSQKLSLQPGSYAPATFEYPIPNVEGNLPLESVLLLDGKPVHTESHTLKVFARRELQVPAGKKLVAYDPSGKWPGSVKTLGGLEDVAGTMLLIAPEALTGGAKADVPSVGGNLIGKALHSFLSRGGRVIVLEQSDLSPLGLGLEQRDNVATMAFPLNEKHPVLQGLGAGDLCYWQEDNYVVRRQIVRPASGGAKAIAVTGGPDWLAHSPIVEMPVGAGRIVLMQALVGEKLGREPAAAVLLQNAVNYLAACPASSQEPAAAISGSGEGVEQMRKLGVLVAADAKSGKFVIVEGGGEAVTKSADRLRQVLAGGGTVYWHSPTPEAFAALRETLGAKDLRVHKVAAGVSLADRGAALLDGISREDVLCTSKPQGWDRQMRYVPGATSVVLEPDRPEEPGLRLDMAEVRLQGARLQGQAVSFDRRGTASFAVKPPAAGIYQLLVKASGTVGSGEWPLIMVEVNGQEICWFGLEGAEARTYAIPMALGEGANTVELRFLNGSEWGGGRSLRLESLALSSRPAFGDGVEVLTLPAAVATWKVGNGRVVVDGIAWERPWNGMSDPRRFASGLLANLGAPFAPPGEESQAGAVPLAALQLVGESPYFGRGDGVLNCYSNVTLETPIQCAEGGQYRVRLTGHGTAFQGKYPRVQVVIDGKPVGSVEIASATDKPFATDPFELAEGRHTLRLVYGNDEGGNGEDRNLFLRGVEFGQ